MEDMSAMTYEYIMRKAFSCVRGGADGRADAGKYRRLSQAYGRIKQRKVELEETKQPANNKPTEELEQEARVEAARICMALQDAIQNVIKNKYPSAGQKEKLRELNQQLHQQFDQEEINRMVEEINEVFNDLNLRIG